MSLPCQSSALPTASTAAWASRLQRWGAAREPTTTAPSRWSTASCPPRTSSTTSAPTALTASRSRLDPCRRCPDTSPSSPAWSTPTRPSPSWARAAGRGSTPPAGGRWGPLTAPVQTCRRAAAGDTQTFPPARLPGWTRWTTDSFDSERENGKSASGTVACGKDSYAVPMEVPKKGGKKGHSLKSTWSSSGCSPVVKFYLLFKFCQMRFLFSHHYKLFFSFLFIFSDIDSKYLHINHLNFSIPPLYSHWLCVQVQKLVQCSDSLNVWLLPNVYI